MDKNFDSEVQSILNVVSSEGPRAVGLKQLYQAVFNCFDEVLANEGARNLAHQANLPTIAMRYFSLLLKPVMMRMKKDFCAEHFKKISQFFKEVLNFPGLYHKHNNKVDMLCLDEVEEAIVHAF